MPITDEERARQWGGPEMVPTYLPGGDPHDRSRWQMERTIENFIRNPLVSLAWPLEVRRALVREVLYLRKTAAEAEGCYHFRRNDCTPNDSE